MPDTPEVVTDYLLTWLVNEPGLYEEATRLARSYDEGDGDTSEMAKAVTAALDGALGETAAWHTRKNITDEEMGIVDWDAVAATLLAY